MPIVLTGLCTQFVILNSAGLLTFIAINETVFHLARANTPFITLAVECARERERMPEH